MSAAQKDKESKGRLVAAAIFGAVLIIAALYSLSRTLHKSAVATGDASAPPGLMVPAPTNLLTPEEIKRQHAMYQTAPVIPAPVAAPPAVIPAGQKKDEVILQAAKADVNQRIVERMKQFVKDNPARDNRELEKQIKKRESRGAPVQ